MERTKDLFMMMREQEVNTSNFLPTKKEVETSAREFITNVIDAGEINTTEALSQVLRMRASIDVVEKELKTSLSDDNFEAFGIKGSYRNGYDKPNFEDDEVYKDLKKKLKHREDLLKVALKSDEEIYDSEGVMVPKVSTTSTKGSLVITF